MKLPNIGVKNSEFSGDVLASWLDENFVRFTSVEYSDINALFMPYAASEMCSLMVLQTLKQITSYERYQRIVVLGCAPTRVTKGIYISDGSPYRTEITEFSTALDPELQEKVSALDLTMPLTEVSQDFIDLCDIAQNLPIIATATAEHMLPIVPVTYKNAEQEDLKRLLDLLIGSGSLVILCGGLSHSLSIHESKSLDSEAISKVIALDSSIRNIQCNCFTALNSLVQLADAHYWRPRLISYQSTGSKHNIKNTAGYASIVFYRQ